LHEDLGKLRRRERTKIYYDILCSIIGQEFETRAKITRVQNDVNLPSDRLRTHLREMSSLGLVDYGEFLASTEKGRVFVDEFKKVVEILRQFGLQ
jgi:predicted transcriptional regulator